MGDLDDIRAQDRIANECLFGNSFNITGQQNSPIAENKPDDKRAVVIGNGLV